MFSRQFVAFAICVLPAHAAPSPLVSVRRTGDAIAGRYIVNSKDDVGHSVGISSISRGISPQSEVTHDWSIINGFAGAFVDADLEV